MRLLLLLSITAFVLSASMLPVLGSETPTASLAELEDESLDVLEDIPDDQDVDMRSLFNAMFADADEDDEGQPGSNREARIDEMYSPLEVTAAEAAVAAAVAGQLQTAADGSAGEQNRAVSDPATIAKYNNFMDLFFRRLNAELRKEGDPVSVNLTKGAGKGNKKSGRKGNKKSQNKKKIKNDNKKSKKGANKTGKNKKNKEVGQRHPKDLKLDHLDEDDEEEMGVPVEAEEETNSRVKRETLEEEEEEETFSAVDDEEGNRAGRGLGMEKRRKQQNALDRKKSRAGKRKPGRNAGNRKSQNKNAGKNKKNRKTGNKNNKNRRNKQKKEKKNNSNKRKNKNAGKSASVIPGLPHVKRSVGGPQARRASSKKSSKKSKKSRTRASVSGFSTMNRRGAVTITQSANSQKINSDFTLGPLIVDVTRSFGAEDSRSARTTATSLSGNVVIEVSKTGKAKVAKFKIFSPTNLKVTGSLSRDGSKKSGKEDKLMQASIKRVSPKISKKIKNAARSVLVSTSSSSRN